LGVSGGDTTTGLATATAGASGGDTTTGLAIATPVPATSTAARIAERTFNAFEFIEDALPW
jgi:hypothetical protein